jgi:hypothetical protein
MSHHLLRRSLLAAPALLLVLGVLAPASVAAATDSDHDRLPNIWETTWSKTSPFRADTDRDGIRDDREDPDHDTLTNRMEYLSGMRPRRADSDRDGIRDDREDTDRDGLRTRFEFRAGTSPRRADSDHDGRRDGSENPDRDGLSNTTEQRLATNPKVADTDHDGWSDGAEYRAGTDPRSASSYPNGPVAPPPTTAPPPPTTAPPPPTAGTITVPASINATCATNVSPAINSWIAAQPNGSTLTFPAGSCYLIGGDMGINLKNRSGLTLDGTGSTLRLRTSGVGTDSSAFFMQNSTHITIRGFAVDGDNPATGTTSAWNYVDEHIGAAMIYTGSKFIEFDRVSWDRLRGFGILISSNEGTVWPEDIYIHDSTIRGAECGLCVIAGRRITFSRNNVVDTMGSAVDLEPDSYSAGPAGQPGWGGGFENVLIADNDFTRWGWVQTMTTWFVAFVPQADVVATAYMNGLTVRDNRIHVGAATADNGNFDGIGGLAIRGDATNLKRNITITNNWTMDDDTRPATRFVMYLHNVENLTVTNNRQPIDYGKLLSDVGTSGTRIVSGNDVSP